jgi:predicted nucleotidyltransferase
MAKKPVLRHERMEVVYAKRHWDLLQSLRHETARLMEPLLRANINCIVHGSIARGDVSPTSDIDVFIPSPPTSVMIEQVLERSDIHPIHREIVQATPSYAAKAHIEVGDMRSISFPLVKLRVVERDFYRFGGELTLQELRQGRRVPGVDKRLMLIEPTREGHVESGIIGYEGVVASILGVRVDVVRDRVRILVRRDKVGRTGVFVSRELNPTESFEAVFQEMVDNNPAIRRRLRTTEK